MRDIGANLGNAKLNGNMDGILNAAISVGVTKIDITGTSIESSEHAIKMSIKHPLHLAATAGIHPHNAKLFSNEMADKLLSLQSDRHVLMLGEMGLDCEHEYSPFEQQIKCFGKQLEMANGKPLFLHFRGKKAIEIGLGMLGNGHRGVVHCFTGDKDDAKKILDAGMYIGITGWVCDPKRGKALRGAVSFIPADRILLETDSPYLLPMNKPNSKRGDANTPSNLPYILNSIADILGMSNEKLEVITDSNAMALIGWHNQ